MHIMLYALLALLHITSCAPSFLPLCPSALLLSHFSLQYKHPEGSDWERRALYAGYKELMDEVQEVEFAIPEVEYEFGQAINFEVSCMWVPDCALEAVTCSVCLYIPCYLCIYSYHHMVKTSSTL